MGHHMNAPPPPPALAEEFGDFSPVDEFGMDAAPSGPNAPNAHKETMSGEGFVLMSDFCTEDGRQANMTKPAPAPTVRKKAARNKSSSSVAPPPDSGMSGGQKSEAIRVPVRADSPDLLARKNDDGTEMTVEQLLNSFMSPPATPSADQRAPIKLPSVSTPAPPPKDEGGCYTENGRACRQACRQAAGRHADRQTRLATGRQTGRQAEKQTGRQAGRQTSYRQTDRETNRQADRQAGCLTLTACNCSVL